MRHILTRHEQGAVHAADGYARATGKPGVCIATSGPGATNLVTGIANAYLDSVPLIAITGQVPVESIGRDSFQEADIMGITMPITKHSYLVKELEDLPYVLEEAWNVATTGRQGPVLIDIPKDIFTGSADFTAVHKPLFTRKVPLKNGLKEQLEKVLSALQKARNPLVLSGGGIIAGEATRELAEFVKYTGIPVVTTLMGKGSYPETREECLGLVGMHGKAAANLALSSCDLLLGIGVRFSDRITGKPQSFLPQTCIVHVDIDPAELRKNIRTDIPVVCQARKFLTELTRSLRDKNMTFSLEQWTEQIRNWKDTYPLYYESGNGLKPQQVIEEVALHSPGKTVVVTDVGQHQMFTAQYYPVDRERSFITSGGLGTMGFGLPAAIGASMGRPDENVVLFTGDGSIQMNIQELITLAQHGLPVKVFILNNGCLGMVRQWQELFFNKHYAHTIFACNPDFVALAAAYGVKGMKISTPAEVGEKVAEALQSPGPVLVECIVEQEENVFPMVPPGGKPSEMLGRWQGETHISRIG